MLKHAETSAIIWSFQDVIVICSVYFRRLRKLRRRVVDSP